MHKYTKKELKRMKKKLGSAEGAEQYLRKEKLKSFISTISWILGIVAFLGLFFYFASNRTSRSSVPPVHWHIGVSYNLCGDTNQLAEKEDHSLLHGHQDGQIHVEGRIPSDNAIKLGKFFDNIGIEFDTDRIAQYKNGDKCPESDTAGKVQLLVNGAENPEFREYVLQEGDNIEIVFQ